MLKRIPKAGLIFNYFAAHERSNPRIKEGFREMMRSLADQIRNHSIEVVDTSICMVYEDFKNALDLFISEEVDIIFSVNLTWSPSISLGKAYNDVNIPLVMINTSPVYEYSPENTHADTIYYGFGAHGTQDFCNVLTRQKHSYFVESGYYLHSDLIQRVSYWAIAASIMHSLKKMRVGIIGRPFEGMGDAAIPDSAYSSLGITKVLCNKEDIGACIQSVSDQEIEDEIRYDKKIFTIDSKLPEHVIVETEKVCLGLRKWFAEKDIHAFTYNFTGMGKEDGFDVVPFVEASKSMRRGIGCAGESDALCAAVNGALLSSFSEVSFGEIQGINWKDETLLFSHIGEISENCIKNKGFLTKMEFPFRNADQPAILYGCLKPGNVTLVNFSLVDDDKNAFQLILIPAEVLDMDNEENYGNYERGWIKPKTPVQTVLTRYAELGGSHHMSVVYGTDVTEVLVRLGKLLGCCTSII